MQDKTKPAQLKENTTKTWSGRFSEPVAELVKRYTASVDFDKRLAEFDIQREVLQRTREKVEKLEVRVAELEARSAGVMPPPPVG